MATQGPLNPSASANNAAVGTIDWNFLNNVFVADSAEATWSTGAVQCIDSSIKIVQGGSVGGTEHALAPGSGGLWSTLAYTTYGSSADLWGLTWGASDINNSGFGVAISSFMSGKDSADTSHYLVATGFGFSIPTGATINGITVEIRRAAESLGAGTLQSEIDHVRITVDYTEALTTSTSSSTSTSTSISTSSTSTSTSFSTSSTSTSVSTSSTSHSTSSTSQSTSVSTSSTSTSTSASTSISTSTTVSLTTSTSSTSSSVSTSSTSQSTSTSVSTSTSSTSSSISTSSTSQSTSTSHSTTSHSTSTSQSTSTSVSSTSSSTSATTFTTSTSSTSISTSSTSISTSTSTTMLDIDVMPRGRISPDNNRSRVVPKHSDVAVLPNASRSRIAKIAIRGTLKPTGIKPRTVRHAPAGTGQVIRPAPRRIIR